MYTTPSGPLCPRVSPGHQSAPRQPWPGPRRRTERGPGPPGTSPVWPAGPLAVDTGQPQLVEHSGSGVELRTLDYENPGSNPGCGVKTLGKFFHSTLLQFTQLNK